MGPAAHPSSFSQGIRKPPAQLLALRYLHVQNCFLVPVLPTIPDRQGVIAPLQVKLLEGELDHLGREHGIREQAGAAAGALKALRTAGSFLTVSRRRGSPWRRPTGPSIQTEHFHASILSVNYFSPGCTVSGVP